MSISKKLLKHLDTKKVKYTVVPHKTVFTAYDLAQTLRAKLEDIAKTLVVKADKNHLIVVLPGNRRLDFSKLQKLVKAKKVDIAKEDVMQKVFGVKPGALTPFGALYKGAPVLIDTALAKAKKILAGAGTYEESLHMTVKDFLKATEGKLGNFSEKSKIKLQQSQNHRIKKSQQH
ncbi:YbaK/EbsC family protein [Candidatus Uhrbacteria bacterium]|nr:YbaK/EbsC family protein [Candidatus Uhrbacteria bacterium]